MPESIGEPTGHEGTIPLMLYNKDKIIELRKKLGISRNELARRAGIKGPSLHAIEHGLTKEIKTSTLLGLAAALGVPMQELMRPGKGRSAKSDDAEAMMLFARLDDKNKVAILAALRALAGPSKK